MAKTYYKFTEEEFNIHTTMLFAAAMGIFTITAEANEEEIPKTKQMIEDPKYVNEVITPTLNSMMSEYSSLPGMVNVEKLKVEEDE